MSTTTREVWFEAGEPDIAAALDEHRVGGPKTWTRPCQGSKFHSPTPLLTQRIKVGPTEVHLCGVCQDNLQVFVALMKATDGDLDWVVRREFGNMLRALGMKAWKTQ